MYEYELRARIDNPDIFVKKLETRGCKLSDKICQDDLIYTHDTLKPVARIRRQNSSNILTLKTLEADRNIAKEYEVYFSSSTVMDLILRDLGFNEPIFVSKTRRNTHINQFLVSFDFVRGLGYFVELEVMQDKESTGYDNDIFVAMKNLLCDLGIQESAITNKKYYEMIASSYGG